jgi:hypothetical protein
MSLKKNWEYLIAGIPFVVRTCLKRDLCPINRFSDHPPFLHAAPSDAVSWVRCTQVI